MIPLRDNIPRERAPLVTWTIIALNTLLFFYELSLPERMLEVFLHLYGVVPARFTNPTFAAHAGYPDGGFESLFTYMFLHGGWLHFLLNMWVFWVFADNVEDVLGHAGFVVFYVVCGLAALFTHMLFHASSTIPVIGASGAVAGVMGAYFRLFPHARVVTLIPIFIFPFITELPATVFLGIWFFIQLFSGLFDSVGQGQSAPVAFFAHVGGFVAGYLLMRLFGTRRCRYCWRPDEGRYE
ncbi:rhomboid family intramembrane serine protease [Desulfolutivibrio sulfoxidireducens]|uniref:rhomboid family intramembrane serine protease n=1 Tax=Desulfolutivibrio sulfoxidireducens TaxID=2773299 RepID=UPI00159D5E64|nr:rhomboid family intramembrane serine protease [Desulfolutivibrio sulfoxidireducens]QLA16629.1 rhomboid family intramembrane serine protease [Desulfolutivibrio sulfoxidireducens]QLA19491.1 rhomboid family intramembrane serine protease [Desulfolutivibrio sulfoxidireducens]